MGDFDLGKLLDVGKLFDPGALAHAAADAILPKDMQWMGGLVGAAVDFECGNYFGAVKEGLDVVKDLKEKQQSSPKQPGFNPPGGWSYEPCPPPPTEWRSQSQLRATPPASASTTVTTTATATATATATVTISGSPNGQEVVAHAGAGAVAHADAVATASFQTSSAAPAPAPAPSAWRGTPSHSNLLNYNPFFGGQRLVGTKDPATMSKAEFMAQGNEAFMKAVRDGKIPQEISDSPAAMQALQARMNQISEMNQLMTSMIQAMHQMQMAVIQNVRV